MKRVVFYDNGSNLQVYSTNMRVVPQKGEYVTVVESFTGERRTRVAGRVASVEHTLTEQGGTNALHNIKVYLETPR